MIQPVLGRPRIGSEQQIAHRVVSRQGMWTYLANGAVVDGTLSRDHANTEDPFLLRPGLLMGKVTATSQYAPSSFGLTGAAYSSGTSLTLSVAAATELNRRVGASGTFKLTGPPTAAGTVRTLTITYSAVNTTTGVVTITAPAVNEVQTVNLVTAGTAGNVRLIVQKTDGTYALTPNIAWNATDATVLSNANTALDTATGVSGGIVATAIAATDTDLGFVLTYSGTGYAGSTWALAEVDTMFTSNTGANVVRTTTGVNGAFVTASVVQPTDGSETPLTLIPDGYGVLIPDDSADVDWPTVPIGAVLDFSKILPAVSDASLKTWVKQSLSTLVGGKFTFSDTY